MAAPNGARRGKKDHPALPETINEIAAAAAACQAAGAGALHAHLRDQGGAHILDAGLSRELLQEIANTAPGMPVQITTESAGRYSPTEQRQFLYALRPPLASVALAEMFSDNDTKSATDLYHWAADNQVDIQHILRHPKELQHLSDLIDNGTLPKPQDNLLQVLFVLGSYQLSDATPDMLLPFLQAHRQIAMRRPFKIRFMTCAFGRGETDCLLSSAKSGGDCRVGFENNVEHPNGDTAKDNAERVREVADALRQHGYWATSDSNGNSAKNG